MSREAVTGSDYLRPCCIILAKLYVYLWITIVFSRHMDAISYMTCAKLAALYISSRFPLYNKVSTHEVWGERR